ncbi:hypothetical protein F4778DRAFT_780757 [Xylariomycetidae sp. FL2044]|nr:hypothetical protein F4778DRAFT_780757 [Xylariomycetidae sp. FL2044]
MEQFTVFQKLAPELRLYIWEEAFAEEAANRLIILFGTQIVPFKNLVSPLLSTNRESRQCVLKLCDLHHHVYKVPEPEPDRLCWESFLGSSAAWKDHDPDLDDAVDLASRFAANEGESLGSFFFRSTTRQLLDNIS